MGSGFYLTSRFLALIIGFVTGMLFQPMLAVFASLMVSFTLPFLLLMAAMVLVSGPKATKRIRLRWP